MLRGGQYPDMQVLKESMAKLQRLVSACIGYEIISAWAEVENEQLY
jgi:hypothetical protein